LELYLQTSGGGKGGVTQARSSSAMVILGLFE